MCMPTKGSGSSPRTGKVIKKAKSVPFNEKLMYPDPNFIDERKKIQKVL